MRKFGEDANRLALALDHAEAGSDLEREIIHGFLERFAATQRYEEAKWWHPGQFKPAPANKSPYPPEFHYIGCMCMGCGRIAELEAERQAKGEQR